MNENHECDQADVTHTTDRQTDGHTDRQLSGQAVVVITRSIRINISTCHLVSFFLRKILHEILNLQVDEGVVEVLRTLQPLQVALAYCYCILFIFCFINKLTLIIYHLSRDR